MKIVLLLILWMASLYALEVIDIVNDKDPILTHCDRLIKDKMQPIEENHLNLGIENKKVFLHCQIQNSSNHPVTKALYFTSPLLEYISLTEGEEEHVSGMLVNSLELHRNLYYYFLLTLPAHTKKDYYLEVQTIYTPISFSILLSDREQLLHQDQEEQLLNIFLIGIVVALMLYAFLLSLYIKDRSYLLYSIYLFFVIYQQMSYLGMTQIYMPLWFIHIDAKITIIKITLLLISSALFAISFLRTKKFSWIHRVYVAIIILALAEALLLNPQEGFSLYILTLTGLLFILYNLMASFFIYRQGIKEARLFIAGFLWVFLSYVLIIVDALGLFSVMYHFRSLLLVSTVIEALILSLAFADRYLILEKEKAKADRLILQEAQDREAIIRDEVEKKTEALNQALKEKELLMQEIHHRVKNNLQVILSMIRLQEDMLTDDTLKRSLVILENRIGAIAKSYSSLMSSKRVDEVDMNRYLSMLLDDLNAIYNNQAYAIKIVKHIEMRLSFQEAVYVGLIVNELVTNAFKHAFDGEGEIEVALYREENQTVLEVIDNGKGFDPSSQDSLGLMIVEALVKGKLKGDLKRRGGEKTVMSIRF